MIIALAWPREPESGREPQRVGSSLQRLFAPLFREPPKATMLRTAAADLVFLELPVQGWRAPFFQEDERTWALAVEYPVNALKVLGLEETGGHEVLPALCRALEDDPARLLAEVAPPFSLLWSNKATGELFVQNDGLGQAQLFEFGDGRSWAVTNKLVALKALDLPLALERDEWAVRATLGWFPLETTGFKGVRYMEPATQLRVGRNGLRRSTCEVLSEWLHPEVLSRESCLELARCSLLEQVAAVMPLWERPTVGLSGGWDSRAVVSSLLAAGAEFSARVRGLPGRPDVALASELARLAGFRLRIRESGGMPGADAEAARRSIALGLLWQAGAMSTRKHKTFLARKLLDGGVVNVMGQHAEIGRSLYAHLMREAGLPGDEDEDRFVDFLMSTMPPFTRKELRSRIRDVIVEAYRRADRYDLRGLERLDFFYLYERTRRGNSGSLNSQTGLVFTPFLNPDYIRATFAYSGSKEDSPFHRHIVAVNTPAWLGVPVAEEVLAGPSPPLVGEAGWRRVSANKIFDHALYWQEVGKPLVDEALAQDGLWSEIFDPTLAAEQWQDAPDQLVLISLLPTLLSNGPGAATTRP